jgi:hypothetical protein
MFWYSIIGQPNSSIVICTESLERLIMLEGGNERDTLLGFDSFRKISSDGEILK